MAARDLGRSVKGSEECFDFNCSKCLKKKSVQKADYYCPECKALFCKSCLGDGKCTHDVLGQDSADKWGKSMQLVSFDTCKRHKWNEVQLYCPRQGVVCCSTCNAAGRKTSATESNEKVQEKTIQRLEKEVEHLEDEKKQIRSRLLQLQKLNKAQAEEIIAVTEDNNATQERITQLHSLNKEQAGQIRDLTDDKTAAKDRFVELENKAKTLEERTYVLEKDKLELLCEKEKLEMEKQQQANTIQALADHNAAFQEEMTQLQHENRRQTGEIKSLTEDIKAAEDTIQKGQAEIDAGCLREGFLHEQLKQQKSIKKGLQKDLGATERDLKELKDEYKDLKEKFVELENKAKTLEERTYVLEKDKLELLCEKEKLEMEKQQQANTIQALADHNAAFQEEMTQLQHENRRQTGEIKSLTEDIKAAEDTIQKGQAEIDAGCLREGFLHEQLKQQKSIIKGLQKDLGATERDLKELKDEYKDLKEKFGKMAGEKMKRNNPDIINLGDQNRSTKIAERYSTMYNEAWTDAWADQTEELNIPEEEASENLLQVLMYCYKYCTEHAESQYEQLSNILNNPIMAMDMSKPVRQEASAAKDSSDTTLREMRKEISLRATEQVKNEFWEHMTKVHRREKWLAGSKVYILQCAEICWAMVLSLPPLYMEFDVKQGTRVDTNFYTKRSSGNMVKQLVWPALFNGKGGGMLAKGVVEAAKTKSKK